METMMLTIDKVSHRYGNHRILHDINLKIPRGSFCALVGPSGCGKTTLLNAIVGTDPPSEGQILAAGKPVRQASPDIGIVYQHYSLYPHLTALANVSFGPIMRATTTPQRIINIWRSRELYQPFEDDAKRLLKRVGLEASMDRWPREMSGGMKQRVAIARALVMHPKVLLLDEPFGALDEATRESLQNLLLTLYQDNLKAQSEGKEPRYTVLIVTHELNEAIYVSDRIIGLSQFHKDGEKMGATVCYDKVSPVFNPDDPRDFNSTEFVAMRQDIRSCVFDPKNCGDKSSNQTFWPDYFRGEANGIMKKGSLEAKKSSIVGRELDEAKDETYGIFSKK